MKEPQPVINQNGYGNLSIDNSEKDCVIVWCHERTEANCIIIERENIAAFIGLLKTTETS